MCTGIYIYICLHFPEYSFGNKIHIFVAVGKKGHQKGKGKGEERNGREEKDAAGMGMGGEG